MQQGHDHVMVDLFEEAKKYIPGGVNSPVRAFKGVGGIPRFFTRGKGAYLYDKNSNEFIDYVGSWGALILGHAHPTVVRSIQDVCESGLSFGAPTEIESELAKLLCRLIPSVEMIRMVNSGTEASMTAIRLARGYTGRNKIIKFNGCYHGHSDSLLVKAGSGGLTLGQPDSAGVPKAFSQDTLVAEFNRLEQVRDLFTQYGDEIAGVIVEPIAGNMSCVPPNPDFLEELRILCDQYQSLLIFDEVMTGFRVDLRGAQNIYNVTPDLTLYAKVIGGGLPVGALGGKKKIMEYLAPLGPVYQAGTLSGNPLAMTAGNTTLNIILQDQDFYVKLGLLSQRLCEGLENLADKYHIPLKTHAIGGMFGLFFTDKDQILTLGDVKDCNQDLFQHFFHGMLTEGIYFAPSAFESGFVSAAHTDAEIDKTLNAADKVFKKLSS